MSKRDDLWNDTIQDLELARSSIHDLLVVVDGHELLIKMERMVADFSE